MGIAHSIDITTSRYLNMADGKLYKMRKNGKERKFFAKNNIILDRSNKFLTCGSSSSASYTIHHRVLDFPLWIILNC